MEFLQNDLVIVNPLKMKRWIVDELESSMVLYFTGRSRSSAAIINEQKKNTSEGNQTAIEAMHKIKQSAIDTKLALLKGGCWGSLLVFWVKDGKIRRRWLAPLLIR